MSALRCGPLAAWTSAWLAGSVSLDDVVDAVTRGGATHSVTGADNIRSVASGDNIRSVASGDVPSTLLDLLGGLRRSGGPVRVVLPVPGDVRGLPGPAAFRTAATDAGAAVVAPGVGVTVVEVEPGPSSRPPAVHWRLHTIDDLPPDPLSVAQAQYDLAEAVRETAGALAGAEVAGASADQVAGLSAARRAGDAPNLPRGFPARAVGLVSQAERLQAVVDLALLDPVGGAVDRTGIAARAAALRPLVTAVRRARAAGYNALTEQA